MLYVIATPIGNLADITYRAIEALKGCNYLLCEDTRHSQVLLKHYAISKPLKSFHKFSESAKESEILEDLKQGKVVGLVSDAGTPGISDPGSGLVRACVAQGIRVVPIPGPCAAITALCACGLETDRFQFMGFLPRKAGELKKTMLDVLSYPGTTICYESPHRLIATLECLQALDPHRLVTVARELTKKFEEFQSGKPQELIALWEGTEIKGEIVLLVSGKKEDVSQEWINLTPQEHVAFMQEAYGVSRQEAIVSVAKIRGASKRDVYNAVHQTDK